MSDEPKIKWKPDEKGVPLCNQRDEVAFCGVKCKTEHWPLCHPQMVKMAEFVQRIADGELELDCVIQELAKQVVTP